MRSKDSLNLMDHKKDRTEIKLEMALIEDRAREMLQRQARKQLIQLPSHQ
jgi:hypothetical protein